LLWLHQTSLVNLCCCKCCFVLLLCMYWSWHSRQQGDWQITGPHQHRWNGDYGASSEITTNQTL
jgi:hypothetical protein